MLDYIANLLDPDGTVRKLRILKKLAQDMGGQIAEMSEQLAKERVARFRLERRLMNAYRAGFQDGAHSRIRKQTIIPPAPGGES